MDPDMQLVCSVSLEHYAIANVRCFGAIGDGIADDTQAIQDAIDSKQSVVVYFPPGKYRVTSPIIIRSSVQLCGAGPGNSILKLADGVQTDVIINWAGHTGSAQPDTNMIIRDLAIDGNKSNNPRKIGGQIGQQFHGTWDQAGIHWKKVTNSSIINCHVHDCAWIGISMSGGRDNEVIHTRSNNNGNVTVAPNQWGQFEAFGIVLWSEGDGANGHNMRNRILFCTTNGNEKHGIELLGNKEQDNLIMGCTANGNNSYGIMLNCGGSSHAASVVDCTCTENAEGGIGVVGDYAIITGNHLARNNHGKFLNIIPIPTGLGGAALNMIEAMHCTVANNTILDSLPIDSSSSIQGIYLSGHWNRVTGNLVRRVQTMGILFGGASNIIAENTVIDAGADPDGQKWSGIQGSGWNDLVEGNTVYNASGFGILFNATGGNHRILSNHVESSGASGIVLDSQADCIIDGNRCTNNGVAGPPGVANAGIALVGTASNTIVSNNRVSYKRLSLYGEGVGIYLYEGNQNNPGTQNSLVSGNILLDNAFPLIGAKAGDQIGLNIP